MGWPEWISGPAGWLRGLRQARATASPLRIEARVSLGAKKSLVLVNCRGRQVLLALSGDAVVPVMELPAARARGAGKGAGR